jgi:hypothetical protein
MEFCVLRLGLLYNFFFVCGECLVLVLHRNNVKILCLQQPPKFSHLCDTCCKLTINLHEFVSIENFMIVLRWCSMNE